MNVQQPDLFSRQVVAPRMSADIEEWKDQVRAGATRFRNAIVSNEVRLDPAAVQKAKDYIANAMFVVGVEDTES